MRYASGNIQAALAGMQQQLMQPPDQQAGGQGQYIQSLQGMMQDPAMQARVLQMSAFPGAQPFQDLPAHLQGLQRQMPQFQGGGGLQAPNPAAAAGMPGGLPPRLQALAQKDPAAAQARYQQFLGGQLQGQEAKPGSPMNGDPGVSMGPPGSLSFPAASQGQPQNPNMASGGGYAASRLGTPQSPGLDVVSRQLQRLGGAQNMGGPGSDVGFQPAADGATLEYAAQRGAPPQFQSGGGLQAPGDMKPQIQKPTEPPVFDEGKPTLTPPLIPPQQKPAGGPGGVYAPSGRGKPMMPASGQTGTIGATKGGGPFDIIDQQMRKAVPTANTGRAGRAAAQAPPARKRY